MATESSETPRPERERPAESKTTSSTLSSIARGMQYAVNSTQEIMEDHYARVFDRYFDKNGNPITVKFNISPDQFIQAPLIALVPLNSLVLDEMTVEMSIEVTGTSQKMVGSQAADMKLERSSFTVSFASGRRSGAKTGDDYTQRDNFIDIVMKFKRGDPPEGVSRVMDEFYKAVVMGWTRKEEK